MTSSDAETDSKPIIIIIACYLSYLSVFIEMSTLGFISSCSDFRAMSAALKHNIVKSAVKYSFDIYCKRNYADLTAT